MDLGTLSYMLCLEGIPFCWLREGLKVPGQSPKEPGTNVLNRWTLTYRHKVGWRTLAVLLSFYQVFWVFCVPKSCNDGWHVRLDRCLHYNKSSTTIFAPSPWAFENFQKIAIRASNRTLQLSIREVSLCWLVGIWSFWAIFSQIKLKHIKLFSTSGPLHFQHPLPGKLSLDGNYF